MDVTSNDPKIRGKTTRASEREKKKKKGHSNNNNTKKSEGEKKRDDHCAAEDAFWASRSLLKRLMSTDHGVKLSVAGRRRFALVSRGCASNADDTEVRKPLSLKNGHVFASLPLTTLLLLPRECCPRAGDSPTPKWAGW